MEQNSSRIDIIRDIKARGVKFTNVTNCESFRNDIQVVLRKLNNPIHELQLQNLDCNNPNFLNEFVFTGFNTLRLDVSGNKKNQKFAVEIYNYIFDFTWFSFAIVQTLSAIAIFILTYYQTSLQLWF